MTTSVPEQIDTAAGAIRAANHAAIGSGLSAPEASAVVGGLGELAHRLPQLLDHVARPLHNADPVTTATTAAATRSTRCARPAPRSTTPATSSRHSPATSTAPTTTSATSASPTRRTAP